MEAAETYFHSLIMALYMLSFEGSAAKAAFSCPLDLVISSVIGLLWDCKQCTQACR